MKYIYCLLLVFSITCLIGCSNVNTTEEKNITEEIVTEPAIKITEENTIYREDNLQTDIANPYVEGNQESEILETTEGQATIIEWDNMSNYYPITINDETITLNKTKKSELSEQNLTDKLLFTTYGNTEDGIIYEIDIYPDETLKFSYLDNKITEKSTLETIKTNIGSPTSYIELDDIIEYTWSWQTEDGILQNNVSIAFKKDNTIDYIKISNINMNTYLAY